MPPLGKAAQACWWVCGGFLVWALDFHIGIRFAGRIWSFDVLNDGAGLFLCTVGLVRLARLRLRERFRTTMALLAMLTGSIAIWSVATLFRGSTEAVVAALPIGRWIGLGGAALFCVELSTLCREAAGVRSAESWTTTLIVLLLATTSPQMIVALSDLVLGEGPSATLRPGVIVVVAGAKNSPALFGLLATWWMERESRGGAARELREAQARAAEEG